MFSRCKVVQCVIVSVDWRAELGAFFRYLQGRICVGTSKHRYPYYLLTLLQLISNCLEGLHSVAQGILEGSLGGERPCH